MTVLKGKNSHNTLKNNTTPRKKSEYKDMLEKANLKKNEAARYQKLAAIPEPDRYLSLLCKMFREPIISLSGKPVAGSSGVPFPRLAKPEETKPLRLALFFAYRYRSSHFTFSRNTSSHFSSFFSYFREIPHANRSIACSPAFSCEAR